ncbi:MAG: T9SS type A sorting domain-containing protein [Candidatus Eisenbacteria bacterium]
MGFEGMVHWEYHTAQGLENAEGVARYNFYGAGGVPKVRIDGSREEVGGGDGCANAANRYRIQINQRLAETGGMSPVSIDGSYMPTGSTIPVQATFRLEDPVVLTSLRATLLIYEHHVLHVGQYWDYVERDLYDQNITLTNVGDEVTVSYDFNIQPTWNVDNISVVAYLQQTSGNKQIIQGLMVPIGDFRFQIDEKLVSIPDGNGTAVFHGNVTNLGDDPDTFTLEVASQFGDWTTDFLVCGDANPHSGPLDIVLDPDESCDVQIRVHTNSAIEARTGSFQVTSLFSSRTMAIDMRVFNGGYAILFVDDDHGRTDEVPWISAMNTLGLLYDHWDATANGGTPGFNQIKEYDYLVWQTGFDMTNTTILLDSDESAIADYLDAGGSVFVSSQHYINSKTGVTPFMRNYFGINAFTKDVGYTVMNGVPGDPIGNGLTLNMTFTIPAFNKGDSVQPTADAAVSFTAPNNVNACLRHELADGGKCVFMAAALHVVDNNTYPNNIAGALDRILGWLEPVVPAGIEDGAVAPLFGSRIDAAQPNPFNPRTQISFTLSQAGASGPVRLEVFDLGGRKVASLFEGTLPAGEHVQTWTGLADNGAPVESGVYFARLTTDDGRASQKLILLK